MCLIFFVFMNAVTLEVNLNALKTREGIKVEKNKF